MKGLLNSVISQLVTCWSVRRAQVLSKGRTLDGGLFSSAEWLNRIQLCDPMDCSTSGFPFHHQLPEFTQTHVHRVGDAIQQSHPLSFPSPTFNLSQHQGLFQWVSSSHQVAKVLGVSASASVLPMNIQYWFPLRWTSWISLQSKGLSRVFSNTTVQKHRKHSSVLRFF